MATTTEINVFVATAVEAIGTSSAAGAISTPETEQANAPTFSAKHFYYKNLEELASETSFRHIKAPARCADYDDRIECGNSDSDVADLIQEYHTIFLRRRKVEDVVERANEILERDGCETRDYLNLYYATEEARGELQNIRNRQAHIVSALINELIHWPDHPWRDMMEDVVWFQPTPGMACSCCGYQPLTYRRSEGIDEFEEFIGSDSEDLVEETGNWLANLDFETVEVKPGTYQCETMTMDQLTISSEEAPTEPDAAAQVATRFITCQPSIENMMAREYLITHGVWTTSQVSGTVMHVFDNYKNIVAAIDTVLEGISLYHSALRSDVEITLRLNAHPFASGQLVLWTIPAAWQGAVPTGTPNDLQLVPHSFLNVAYETNCKLLIRTISCANYAIKPLLAANNNMEIASYIVISTWNALKVATGMPTTLSYSVWARLVDPQLGYKIPKYQAAEHAGGLADIIGGLNIPVISNIAKTVAGVSGNFDAPLIQTTSKLTVCRGDEPRPGQDLRFISNDYVKPWQFKQIELSEYVQIPGRLYVENWSTSQVRGTTIVALPTTINQKFGTSPNSGYNIPLYEVSRHFRYWRGTLRYTFEVIATRFHQGQLLITFCPFGQPTNYDQARVIYNASMDIGTNNRFAIDVPFVNQFEWEETNLDTKGFVHLMVQNPLIAPSNVSLDVAINVYVSGGDDLEFSVPRAAATSSYQSASGQMLPPVVWKPMSDQALPPASIQRERKHMSMTDLLRRPPHEYNVYIPSESTTRIHLAKLPWMPKASRTADIQQPYNFYMARGSTRWTMRAQRSATVARPITAVLVLESNQDTPVFPKTPWSFNLRSRDGMVLEPSCLSGNEMMWEIPHYGRAPVFLAGADTPLNAKVYPPCLDVFVDPQPGNTNAGFYCSFLWSAGDDFEVLWPLPNITRTIPALGEDDEEDRRPNDGTIRTLENEPYYEDGVMIYRGTSHYQMFRGLPLPANTKESKIEKMTRMSRNHQKGPAPEYMCNCEHVCQQTADLDCCIAADCFGMQDIDSGCNSSDAEEGDLKGLIIRSEAKRIRRIRKQFSQRRVDLALGNNWREIEGKVELDSQEVHPDAEEHYEILPNSDPTEDVRRMFSWYEYCFAHPDDRSFYIDAVTRKSWKWNADWNHFWGPNADPTFGCHGDKYSRRLFFENTPRNLAQERDDPIEDIQRMFSWFEYCCAPENQRVWYMAARTGHWNRCESYQQWWTHFHWVEEWSLFWARDSNPRFGCYGDYHSNRFFFDRPNRRDPFSRGSLRQLGRDLGAHLQGFGIGDFVAKISDVFGSLKKTITDTWNAIKTTLKLAKRLNKFFESVDDGSRKLKHFSKIMIDTFLPLITACYTAYHASGVMKAIALTQITALLLKGTEPNKPQKVGECQTDGPTVNEETLIKSSAKPGDGVYETYADGVRQLRMQSGKYENDEERPGNNDTWMDNCNDLGNILHDSLKNFVKGVCKSSGFILGPGFEKYIRRIMLGTKPDSWKYIMNYILSVFQYLIYGEALNIEWERKRCVEIGEINNAFVKMESERAFEGKNLDKVGKYGKTNFVQLCEMYQKVTEIRKLTGEMNVPAMYSAFLQRFETTYVECCKLQKMEVTQAEPVGVFLCGTPGVGKSFLISSALPNVLLSKIGLGTRKNKVYPIPIGEQKFWDGYDQQPYLYCDELFQERDGQDPLMVIRVISSARCPVNMASLKNKGITFDSKFFVASSNEQNLQNVTQVHNKEAIKRRFDKFACKVGLRPAYCTNHKMDFRKFQTDFNACSTAAEAEGLFDKVWTFTDIDLIPTGGQVQNPKVRSFSEVVGDLVAEYHSRTDAFTIVEEKMKSFFQMEGDSEYVDASDEDVCGHDNDLLDEIAAGFKQQQEDDEEEAEDFSEPDDPVGTLDEQGGVLRALSIQYIFEGKFDDPQVAEYYATTAHSLILPKLAGQSQRVFLAHWKSGQHPFASSLGQDIPKNIVMSCALPWWTVFDHCRSVMRQAGRKRFFIGLLPMLAAIGLAGTALYFGFQKFGKIAIAATGFYYGYSGAANPKNAFSNTVRKATTGVKILSAFQGSSDVQDKIRKNVLCVKVQTVEPDFAFKTQCLAINDRTLLIPEHLYQHYVEQQKVCGCATIMVTVPHSKEGECEWMAIACSDENSAVLMENGKPVDQRVVKLLATAIPRVGDIRGFVRSTAELNLNNCQLPALVLGSSTGAVQHRTDIDVSIGGYTRFDCAADKLFVTAKFQENISTPGDCGRPYVLGASHAHPIVGVHSVGTNTYLGGMTPISKEEIAAAEKKIKLRIPAPVIMEESKARFEAATSPYWTTQLDLVGKATYNGVSLAHHCPAGTNLRPVQFRGQYLWHEDWECDMLPAAQKPHGGAHPLITNSQKYQMAAFVAIKPSVHMMLVNYFSAKYPEQRRHDLLTMDECINGNDLTQPLAFDTGAGYWGQFGFKDGKKDFFSCLPQEYDAYGQPCVIQRVFSDKAKQHVVPLWEKSFCARLEECETMIRNRVAFNHFWVSTTKDELRPAKKVEAVKTRVFEQPGLEYVLLIRRYFGRFLEFYKSHSGFKYYHGIGQDKEAVWAQYATGFAHMGDSGHAFDYTNWDGSVPPAAFQFFQDVTDRFYNGCLVEEENARHALLKVLREGEHLMGALYFRTNQGNKSGNPFTDVFNSVCNTYIMYTCYYTGRTVLGLPAKFDFDDCIRMLTYGDDIAMSVRPDVISWFTGPLIATIAGLLGVTITDASKSDKVPDSIKINSSDFTFLKSPFIFDHKSGVVLAPLPKKDILKEMKYCPKRAVGDELDMQQRCAVTQRFMAHHGRTDLEQYQRQLRERGIPKTWSCLDYDVFILEVAAKQALAVCERI